MKKVERTLRLKYASILSELTKKKLCPLLQEIELAIEEATDEDEKVRLQKRFKQVEKSINDAIAQIDSLTNEKRMAKATLRLVSRRKK